MVNQGIDTFAYANNHYAGVSADDGGEIDETVQLHRKITKATKGRPLLSALLLRFHHEDFYSDPLALTLSCDFNAGALIGLTAGTGGAINSGGQSGQ